MRSSAIAFALLLAAAQLPLDAAAQDTPTNYEQARKAAADQYASDKKLCADETTSAARMQCLRDAKAMYNTALENAKKNYAVGAKSSKTASICAECGKVLGTVMTEKKGESGPIGLIGGGVAGALLGHQIGGGTGKDIATIAGAAGGAYAGSKIEEKVRATKVWTVSVRFETGEDRTFTFDHDPGFAAGDPVKISGSSIVRR